MWKPGTPANTEEDRRQREVWRRERAVERQRKRREGRVRIDYMPSPEALELIKRHTHKYVGGNYSAIIDKLIKGKIA